MASSMARYSVAPYRSRQNSMSGCATAEPVMRPPRGPNGGSLAPHNPPAERGGAAEWRSGAFVVVAGMEKGEDPVLLGVLEGALKVGARARSPADWFVIGRERSRQLPAIGTDR